MLKPFSNVLIVIMMLVTYAGQALSYTSMSCEWNSNVHHHNAADSAMSMELGDMDHAMMGHDDMTQQGDFAMADRSNDCCGDVCLCPQSASLSMIILSEDMPNLEPVLVAEQSSVVATESTISITQSLYRPPIFA